jgi:lipoprotein signal peptidase
MKKYYPYILGIFGIDLVTKLFAYFFLPFNEYVPVMGNQLEFYLTYNTGAAGTKVDSIIQNINNPNMSLFIMGLFGLLSGIVLFLTKKIKFKMWQKFLIIFFTLFLYMGVQLKISHSNTYIFDNYFISWFTKLGAMALVLGLFVIAKDKWLRIILISYFSCGLGNFINHFYPPFAIIDFIYAPILYKYLHLYICNIADIGVDFCLILLIIRFLIIWIKKLFYKTNAINNR